MNHNDEFGPHPTSRFNIFAVHESPYLNPLLSRDLKFLFYRSIAPGDTATRLSAEDSYHRV